MFLGVTLISIFSFFIYTLHPIKFIPKQQNYAVIFFAPLALLGGYGLARLKGLWLSAAVAFFAIGSLLLSAIWLQRDALHFAAVKHGVQRTEAYSNAVVFISEQMTYAVRLKNLIGKQGDSAQDLRKLDALGDTDLNDVGRSGRAI